MTAPTVWQSCMIFGRNMSEIKKIEKKVRKILEIKNKDASLQRQK